MEPHVSIPQPNTFPKTEGEGDEKIYGIQLIHKIADR